MNMPQVLFNQLLLAFPHIFHTHPSRAILPLFGGMYFQALWALDWSSHWILINCNAIQNVFQRQSFPGHAASQKCCNLEDPGLFHTGLLTITCFIQAEISQLNSLSSTVLNYKVSACLATHSVTPLPNLVVFMRMQVVQATSYHWKEGKEGGHMY